MKHRRTAAIAVSIACTTLTLSAGGTFALPASGIPSSSIDQSGVQSTVENVRWVCGPYRCWWRPAYVYQESAPVWGDFDGGDRWRNHQGWGHHHGWDGDRGGLGGDWGRGWHDEDED